MTLINKSIPIILIEKLNEKQLYNLRVAVLEAVYELHECCGNAEQVAFLTIKYAFILNKIAQELSTKFTESLSDADQEKIRVSAESVYNFVFDYLDIVSNILSQYEATELICSGCQQEHKEPMDLEAEFKKHVASRFNNKEEQP